jgi:hypothetical protein
LLRLQMVAAGSGLTIGRIGARICKPMRSIRTTRLPSRRRLTNEPFQALLYSAQAQDTKDASVLRRMPNNERVILIFSNSATFSHTPLTLFGTVRAEHRYARRAGLQRKGRTLTPSCARPGGECVRSSGAHRYARTKGRQSKLWIVDISMISRL